MSLINVLSRSPYFITSGILPRSNIFSSDTKDVFEAIDMRFGKICIKDLGNGVNLFFGKPRII